MDADEAALAELEEPRGHELKVDRHSLGGRIYSLTFLHRLVPDALALRLAMLGGRLRWLWPPARRRAIGRVALTVKGTHREGQEHELAREELVADGVRTELEWRPWMHASAPVAGSERAEAALAGPRPVILLGSHLGYPGMLQAVARGRRLYAVTGGWMDPAAKGFRSGYRGYKAVSRRRRGEARNLRFIPIGRAYPVLHAVLEAGHTCLMLFDAPGNSRTRLCGKTAYVGGGAARLALETGALIVPLNCHFDRRGFPSIQVHEVVDPHDFAGSQKLLDHLAALFDEEIMRWPAGMEPNGFTRDIWRDDNDGFPSQLWWPPRVRERVAWLGRRAVRRVLPGR